jgi:hypothetical protein
MASVGLVVARYNEDFDWIYDAQAQNPEMNIYVYNKGEAMQNLRPGIFWIKRRAGGNEAETYLTHMIDSLMFDSLDDVTLFVQARPYDHVRQDHLYRIIRNPETVQSFEWLAFHHLDCRVANECHHGGLPISRFYQEVMGKQISDLFHFGVGGMFAIRKEHIIAVGIDHLRKLREMILTDYKDDMPWCILERTWDQVLHVPNAGSLAP